MRREPLRLDFAFTAHDTPELRARIHRDLETVWRRVTEEDPAAESLVLTGGFSRGEGSARGARPLNDYDLVVVRRSTRPRAGPLYARLAEELSDHVGLAVDLAPVARARLPFLAPTAFWFDAKFGGRVLAGDPRVLSRVPVKSARSIPASEGARLLANRAVGLLDAVPRTGDGDPDLARLQAAKAFLACAEAVLVVAGGYHPSMRERRDRFLALAARDAALAPLVPGVRWATDWKLLPDGAANLAIPSVRWAEARDALLATARRVLPRARWGDLARYPDGAPVGVVEWAYATARIGRPAPLRASHLVRALGFQLVHEASWPEGGKLAPACAGRVARAFHEPPPTDWAEARELCVRLRERTLQ